MRALGCYIQALLRLNVSHKHDVSDAGLYNNKVYCGAVS